ncbi:MAG: BTAD domain-containing putative transcriptional regulator [Acidimicrobiales bacterium]
MSDRDRDAPYAGEPAPAPVSEVEAEIKAEIAAEVEAEMTQPAGPSGPSSGVAGPAEPGDGHQQAGRGWAEAPPPVADPAAEVLAWLRGEFDAVNANLRSLSQRLARQEEALLRSTGAQEEELNSSLAELEGCSAQLRNESATLRDTRTQLPGLVAEAVQAAVATTVDNAVRAAVAELRASVAQLGAALTEALPGAVAEALTPALAVDPDPAPADDGGAVDPVSQLHEAPDEAAEWFTIVVDEAVRRAAERWLAPAAPTPAPPAPEPVTAAQVAAPPVAPDPLPTRPAGVAGDAPLPDDAPPDPPLPAPAADDRTETGSASDVAGGSQRGPADLGGAESEAAAEAVSPPAEAPAGGAAVETVTEDRAAADAGAEQESGLVCVLPGVAVGPTLAMGVSDALGRARLRRRRRRRAGAPTAGLFRQDPFAGEVSRRLERFALARPGLAWNPNGADPAGPERPSERGSGPERPSERGGRPATAFVVVAERDGQELAVDLAATSPLALVGPDAHDAARALVTTFLAVNEPASGRAVVAGELLPPGVPFPGLERTDGLAAALDLIDDELARRRGPDDATPLVVLATPAVAPQQADRLADLARRGRPLGVAVLTVGEALPGSTVATLQPGGGVRTVAPPDVAPDLAGSRMFSLGLGPASELLDLLAAARTDDDVTPVVDPADEPFPVLIGAAPAPIKVRVLGPYRIDVGGEEIRSGLRAKARELLAFYLLHPEGTTLDVATEALWPEADPGRGSEWFWTALGNLRSLLRNVTGTKALKIVERDGDSYRIEPVFDVDLWRFQAALPQPGAGTNDPEWAAALESAADLYGGELLAGVDWAWADVPREDLRRRAVDVLVSLAATRLVAADVRGALDALSHAVEVDPVAEQLYRRIMRLHAKQFRPDEVDATFRRLQARLGDLDLSPTPECEQLLQELLK